MEIQTHPTDNTNSDDAVPFQVKNSIFLGLFRVGHDTMQIADHFGLTEAEIYNRIHMARRAEADLARAREWRRENPDKTELYRWRKKMRAAGLSEETIHKATWGARQ
jgi:hypothetical protein